MFFIRFPKPHLDRAKAERWVNACRRDGFTVASVKKDTYICSLHFIGEDGPTTETPDPVIATATPSQVSVVTAVYVSKGRAGLGRCRPRIGGPRRLVSVVTCHFCQPEAPRPTSKSK